MSERGLSGVGGDARPMVNHAGPMPKDAKAPLRGQPVWASALNTGIHVYSLECSRAGDGIAAR
jgi:hypothetical protein